MLDTILLVKDFQPLLEQAETVQLILFLHTDCSSYQFPPASKILFQKQYGGF
jgi:hypothetical protein